MLSRTCAALITPVPVHASLKSALHLSTVCAIVAGVLRWPRLAKLGSSRSGERASHTRVSMSSSLDGWGLMGQAAFWRSSHAHAQHDKRNCWWSQLVLEAARTALCIMPHSFHQLVAASGRGDVYVLRPIYLTSAHHGAARSPLFFHVPYIDERANISNT